MASCKYHPDRPGVGICMRCRAVICSDCCTRLDGVNHCHACLKALGRSTEPRSAQRISQIVAAFFLFIAWLMFVGVFWEIQGMLAP
jgi:hypothetical protein